MDASSAASRFADGTDDCMDAGGRATPGAVAEARAARQDGVLAASRRGLVAAAELFGEFLHGHGVAAAAVVAGDDVEIIIPDARQRP